ncbi:hypothetical protein [Vampirovibrio chlorellavorus]|uniref:hypothetical protein n=1 Tax=Vampirovibrio chlorellavorus TaxID=758823 RepID=UPI0026F34ED4|nr:hypothetical protein [Vampirovibrio chlorellavorus]
MRSVNFSGSSISRLTVWQPLSARSGGAERAPVFKMQYQPSPTTETTPSVKASWLDRLKKAFTPREEHVRWMEKAQSGLGLPAGMSRSLLENRLLEKSDRGKGRS